MKTNQMTVLLTGACGGIGKALAIQLAKGGASLFLTDLNPEILADLRNQLSAKAIPGQTITTKVVDLTESDQMDKMVLDLSKLEKPINVLVNNAGISRFEMFENARDQDIEKLIYLNCVVPMKLTRKLLGGLQQLPEARIVNISSTFGAIGFPGYSIYSASKYAVRGFSEALGRELANTSVHVGCFLPRATKTSINSSKVNELNEKMKVSMDEPEVVARSLVDFLCSKKKEAAMGWPEKLLVRVNSVFPTLIGSAIEKKLPLIKQYAG